MNKTFLWIGVVAILAIVVIVGFSSTRPSTASPATTNASPATAPDFSLQKLGGGTIALADYKGREPVILDFWATWCPNCQRDIPHQEAFYEKYKGKVEVIGIDLQEDPSLVSHFVSQYGITYPIALDPESRASQAYNAQYTNYHVLIDKNGNIVKKIPGDISEQDFVSLINL